MSFKTALLVALGGGIGSVLRFWLAGMIPFSTAGFAWATFLVNMGGCFAMGACLPYMHDSITKTLLTAGILGGFTTFSGLGLELFRYLDEQQWKMALLYASSSLILGTVLVWLGYKLGITIQ